MAKRKNSRPDKPKRKTLVELLSPVTKKLVKDLMRRANCATQAEFAKGLSCDANDISRYITGTHVPIHNLTALGERAGLTPKETVRLFGSFIVEFYDAHRLDDDEQPGEVREPGAGYDARSLVRELDAVFALDFTPLGSTRMVTLNLERERLKEACKAIEAGIRREVGAVTELLRGFRERCEKELRQAAAGRYPLP